MAISRPWEACSSAGLCVCAIAWECIAFEISEQVWESGGWGVPPLLLPGKLWAQSEGFDLFPIVSYEERNETKSRMKKKKENKTKDLTLGGKRPIPMGEMWYSPACPLSALQDPFPAALHSWVSSLNCELQGSISTGHSAPAALLVLPIRVMLSQYHKDMTWRGWCSQWR